MDNRRLIDAEKLLKWLDESPEASKFWITHIAPIEKHDLIEDAINQGKFDPDPIPPTIKPGSKAVHPDLGEVMVCDEPVIHVLREIEEYEVYLRDLEVISHD